MNWLYHRNYFGPNRRAGRFEVRFLERRKSNDTGNRASLRKVLRDAFARGLKWVDVRTYFGPDRRSGAFSCFILERRRDQAAGSPPALHSALRQLRVRILEVETAADRSALKDRLTATALLADAQGCTAIGDRLTRLAERLESNGEGLFAIVQSELLAIQAMLQDANA